MKVFINAGHGGHDSGAVSPHGNKECDIARKVSLILFERLKLNGYPTEFYQEQHSLYEVSQHENKSGATTFISIHCNAFANGSANGTEVLYHPASTRGKQIANVMQQQLIKGVNLRDRGIKPRKDLHVLNRTKAAAVLIELAFLSNEHEEYLLVNKPEIFANAIWEGIKICKNNNIL